MKITRQILKYWFTGVISGKSKPHRVGEYGTHWTFSTKSDAVRDAVAALLESVGVSPAEQSPTTLRVSRVSSLAKIRDTLIVLELLPADDRAAWEQVDA